MSEARHCLPRPSGRAGAPACPEPPPPKLRAQESIRQSADILRRCGTHAALLGGKQDEVQLCKLPSSLRLNAAPQEENANRDQPRLHGHYATLTLFVVHEQAEKSPRPGVTSGSAISLPSLRKGRHISTLRSSYNSSTLSEISRNSVWSARRIPHRGTPVLSRRRRLPAAGSRFQTQAARWQQSQDSDSAILVR